MADRLGLGSEVRELKIGQSFMNPKASGFHTIKYDFKPASVDTNKVASVDVGTNHQVTVTVPHLDGAGVPQTVFKGSQKPYQKECVLIIDRITGEITLEKLSSNITVKKTRSESMKPPLPQDKLSQSSSDKSSISSRSLTPPIVGQRISNRTKVTSGSRRPDRPITQLVQKHSPLHTSPNHHPLSGNLRSPKNNSSSTTSSNSNNNEFNNTSMLASLPLIDDYVEPVRNSTHSSHHSISSNTSSSHQPQITISPPPHPPPRQRRVSSTENGVGEMSNSSSSSSSDSDSDSDPDNTVVSRTPISNTKTNGHSNGSIQQNSTSSAPFGRMPSLPPPAQLLNEDLCLSESGSDSD